MVAFLVVSVVNIIFASLLLAGTYKRCHKLVLAWVVMDGVVLGKWSCYVACAKGLFYSKLITYTCVHYM